MVKTMVSGFDFPLNQSSDLRLRGYVHGDFLRDFSMVVEWDRDLASGKLT